MKQQVLSAIFILFVLRAKVNGGNVEEKPRLTIPGVRMLKVERGNPYCNFQRLFGPVCNMTGFDGILTIEPDPMLTNALEVAVIGANTIFLYPTCVPWVKLYNAQDFLTPLHKSPRAGAENESCRTWLRAFDSKISILKSGVHDISLTNSSVQIINLHDLRDIKVAFSNISIIEHLDWKGYKGEFSFAKIGSILNLECNDNLTSVGTQIGQIAFHGFSFNAMLLVLNYTTIDEVFHQGILLNSGIIIIENTILRKVNREGIILGSDATLVMKNVTIEDCQKPCIKTSFRLGSRYFKATDVTVNGEAIENDPDAIRVTLDKVVESPRSLEDDAAHCQTLDDVLLCDFSGFNEKVVLTPTDGSAVSKVNISNVADLHIVEACEMDIVVENTVGIYTQAVRGGKLCKGTEGTLTIINSTFNVLHATNLKQLRALRSQIDEIRADTVDELVSHDSRLNIRQLLVSNKTSLSNTKVDILSASFEGTLHANFTQFINVSDLRIVGNANIVNSEFKHAGIHSITVSGNLLMSHLIIRDYELLPIYLTETGTIELNQILMDDHWHFISAVSYDQVKWESKTSDDLKRLVELRQRDGITEDTALADDGQPHCVVVLQLMLQSSVGKHDVFCNYTDVEDVQSVTVNLHPSIITKSLIIQGAENVKMSDVCTHEITLMNVKNATMEYLPYHCFYVLRVIDSSVMNIANEPTVVKIENSAVGEVETPFPMSNLGIHNSSIGSLIASPVTTHVQNSNITTLKMLMSHQYFVVNHSIIQSIDSLQIFGSGVLINSDIESINHPGILIDGHLLIENVTIKYLDKRSLTFLEEGTLTMVNVDIEQGWIDSFNLSKGSIRMTNVTMLGSPLINDLQVDRPPITTPAPANKGTTSAVKITTVPAAIPSTVATDTPEKLTSVEAKAGTPAPESPESAGSSSGDQPTQPWVKWATAGASIFLALVVVLVALSLVVVVRNYRTGETFSSRVSRMFRPAHDDELQLSTELDVHVAPDNSSTHYSRLPNI